MSETHEQSLPREPRRVWRSIGAVVAGLLVLVTLSIASDAAMHAAGMYAPAGQQTADAIWLIPTAYRIVFGVAGCWLAARLAPAGGRPMRHAMVLGAIGVAAGIVGAAATWDRGPDFGPKWYPIAIFLIPLPCAWVGGKLRGMQLGERADG